MSSTHFSSSRLRTCVQAIMAMLLLAAPALAFDVYTDLPPLLAPPYDSNSEIHIHRAAQATPCGRTW